MDFKTIFTQIADFFYGLTKKQKIVIATTLISVISFVAFLIIYKKANSGPDDGYGVLFENLSAQDSALVLQQLEKDAIPYKIVNEGTIKIPKDSVYKERITIASQGIPKSGKIGFELFDKNEFGATDFEQQIKYLRAIEGELAKTIESLGVVQDAKVHIAFPKESVFTEKTTPPTASIVITTDPMTDLSLKQIVGIKNLVAASIPKLTTENVKIVNQNGVPLGEDGELFSGETVKAQLKYKKEFERAYEEKIIKVLAPIIGGKDGVVAKVSIDFDFSQESTVSEVFDPNSVARSEQTLEEKKEGQKDAEVGGVPGAISNIGPVEGINDGALKEKYQKNTTTTNYEISKKVTNTKGEFAKIKRVTAAVVVDGKYEPKKDESGSNTDQIVFVPLNEGEISSITALVKQSIGYAQDRGDEVSVSNFEFKASGEGVKTPAQEFMSKFTSYSEPFSPVFKFLAILAILAIFYKKVIIPFTQKMGEELKAEDEDLEKEKLFDFGEEDEDTLEKYKKMKDKVAKDLGLSGEFDEEELKYEVLLEKIKSIIEEKPEDVAMLFDTLIKSDADMDRSFMKEKGD